MIHHFVSLVQGSSEHWAVNDNGQGAVLVQLGDLWGEQIRITLTPKQAEEMAVTLNMAVQRARQQ